MKKKTNIIFLFLFMCSSSFGQMDQYNYYRQLDNITEQWQKVDLPDEVFKKVSPDLSDIRIFGITETNDTIEAPYILRVVTEEVSRKEIEFSAINESYNKSGYFYTFEVQTKEPVNQIDLKFKQLNFDWIVTLSGSQDREEWFTIRKNYRILSIKNDQTDYQFTKLIFPDSKYHYYRIQINSPKDPELTSTQIVLLETTKANYRNHKIQSNKVIEQKESKKTEIYITLTAPVSVSYLKINIQDNFDFYRPVKIQYLADSVETPKGSKYNYKTIKSGTLSSVEKNVFKFNSTILQKLKIIIENNNNKPLTIGTPIVKGYNHKLIVRFTDPATYFLTYGNTSAIQPIYDIERFIENIPDEIVALNLGEEHNIQKQDKPVKEPLFKDKSWLWAIMVIVLLILGWFSIKMIRKK